MIRSSLSTRIPSGELPSSLQIRPRDMFSFFRFDQKLVGKLVHSHTNLVLRESLDDTIRHLLTWDIKLVFDESVDDHEEETEV